MAKAPAKAKETTAKKSKEEVQKAKPAAEKTKKEKKEADLGFDITDGIPEMEFRTTGNKFYDSLFSAMFGVPGFPKGKVIMIGGESDTGKTAISGTLTALFQNAGEKTFIANGEGALGADFYRKLGGNPKKTLHGYFEHGEGGFALIRKLVGEMGGQFGFVDSTAFMKPKDATEKNDMASAARLSRKHMPSIETLVRKAGATLILIGQIAEKPGVIGGNPKYIAGGPAFKFHSRIVLTVSGVEKRRDEATKQQIGYTLRCVITKNHCAGKRTTPFDLIVDNMFRIQEAETAAAWAQQFKLVDAEAQTVLGISFEKEKKALKKQELYLPAVLKGKEHLVFDAVDKLFKDAEAGNCILEFVKVEESEEDTTNSTLGFDEEEDDGDVASITVSDEEISESELASAGSV